MKLLRRWLIALGLAACALALAADTPARNRAWT